MTAGPGIRRAAYRALPGLLVCALSALSGLAAANLPDLALPRPDPEPALPAEFDPCSPPVTAGLAPDPAAPSAGEWTRTADHGNALIVAGTALSAGSGEEMGKDSAFFCFSQNRSGTRQAEAQIRRLQAGSACIQLDAGLLSPAMYLIWPRNRHGYGAPMAVNRAEAWWVGPDAANRGETVALHGRNLTSTIAGVAAGKAWIYLKPQGRSAGRWLVPIAANPYKVDFSVPAGLADGVYEVWAHNGHGGRYGWGGSARLNVRTGVVWDDTGFDVRSRFGAVGDGVHDDTTAIRRALAAAGAQPGSTVFLPAGTYLVSELLQLPKGVRLLGEGVAKSTLRAAAVDFAQANRRHGLLWVDGADRSAVAKLTLDAGRAANCALLSSGNDAPSSFRLSDCVLNATEVASDSTLFLQGGEHVVVERTVFNGTGITIKDGRQYQVDHCTFNGMNSLALVNATGHGSEMSFTWNTGQDYDNAQGLAYDPVTSRYAGDPGFRGWCQGVFFKGLNGGGARRNLYFGNNTSLNMGVRLTLPDGRPNTDPDTNNWGEQISFEWNHGKFIGTPSAASSTGLVFAPGALAGVPVASGLIAVVVDGTGQGQWRDVGSLEAASGVVQLAAGQAWNVVPDRTSTVALGWYVANVAGYQNSFAGKPDRVGKINGHGIWGIIPYWGVLNLVFDSNTLKNNEKAIYAVSVLPDRRNAQLVQPNYFHLYLNNTMLNCTSDLYAGIAGNATDARLPGAEFGLVFRNNSASAPAVGKFREGVSLYLYGCRAPQVDMLLFEGNNLRDLPRGVSIGLNPADSAGNLLFIGNTFALGAAAAPGSLGLDAGRGQVRLGLFDNIFAGFANRGAVAARP